MSEAVIVAQITAGCTLIGTILTVILTHRSTIAALDKKSELTDAKLEAKLDKHMAVTDTKIDEQTRETRLHNSFVTRVPILEEKATSLEKRVTDLEHKQAS